MKFYPNPAQWTLLWCTLALAAVITAPSLFTHFGGFEGNGTWMFPRALSKNRTQLMLFLLTAAALLCWRWAAKPPALRPAILVVCAALLGLAVVFVASSAVAARRRARIASIHELMLAIDATAFEEFMKNRRTASVNDVVTVQPAAPTSATEGVDELMKGGEKPPERLPADYFAVPPPARP